MADYKVTDTELTSIANAIRTRGGTSGQLVFPAGFVSAIGDIPSGGGGDYCRLRFYTADGSKLLFTEYVQHGTASSHIGDWASQAGGTTPVDLSNITSSMDVYAITPSNYHETQDGTLGVLVYDNYNVWFFNGFSKGASDISVPSELSQYYAPSSSIYAAYASDANGAYVANLGFYNGIRSWTKNNQGTTAVTGVYATVEVPVQQGTPTITISGATVQTNTYVSPSEYHAKHVGA